jgi:hypothetical protein
MSGGLFFGYFLLAKQKKVSRLSGRNPTLKSHRRVSDTTKTKRHQLIHKPSCWVTAIAFYALRVNPTYIFGITIPLPALSAETTP